MRTTLDIDDSVLAVARAVAEDERISVGAAVLLLVRLGLAAGGSATGHSGFPVFTPPPGAPPIALDLVNAHRDG